MKTIKLIKDDFRQRIYKLNFRVYVDCNGKTLEELYKTYPIELKDGCEMLSDMKWFDMICISDAHTHIERLTFPVFEYIKNGEIKFGFRNDNICGYNTFMIDGGDQNKVFDDRVYIRKLRIANREYN